MSQIVYTSDNLTIFGDIQEKNSEKYLYLAFSIQVNGKTKAFSFYFRLIEAKADEGQTGYLKEYREWYNVFELLGNIGYPIGDYAPTHPERGNIIDKWIEQLIESNTDSDVFYR